MHACTTDHTTHSLTRFIDSGVFIPDSVVECREHHHLTERSDFNGLLHLCQSLQDLLRYCGVPLGDEDNDVGLEQYVQAFRCVCVCVCVCMEQNTILYVSVM